MEGPVSPSSHAFSRVLRLIVYVGSISFLANLIPTVIHEVLGHGVMALLVGGRFGGFGLKWDGMGWADAQAPQGAGPVAELAVLAGGVAATTGVGAVLMLLCLATRSFQLRIALLLISYGCLTDGQPYLLWNAYRPTPPGDIARILYLLDSYDALVWFPFRGMFIAVGAIATLLVMVLVAVVLYRALYGYFGDWVRDGRGWRRAGVLWVLVILPLAGASFIFDWNQIAPGVGTLPAIACVGSVLVAGLGIQVIDPAPWRARRFVVTGPAIVCAGVGAIVAAIATACWLRNGVYWR